MYHTMLFWKSQGLQQNFELCLTHHAKLTQEKNDILMTRPTTQLELFSIILSFLMNKYVFAADIQKMYR